LLEICGDGLAAVKLAPNITAKPREEWAFELLRRVDAL
jgi:hypothetical protein